MCSVVEIKNDSEYYIYYHSPESLETVISPQQSMDYHNLFKISPNRDSDEEDDNTNTVDEACDEAFESLYQEETSNTLDKDYSIEEFVSNNEVNCVENGTADIVLEAHGVNDQSDYNKNDNDQGKVVDSEFSNDNLSNCEKAEDIGGKQMTQENKNEHVNVQFDWTNKG